MSLSAATKDEIRRILSEATESRRLPAVVFGATDTDGATFFASSGFNDMDDASTGPVNEDSVLWICSKTKLITSLAILQLVERGKLTLDTLATDYLPEIANPVVIDDSDGHLKTRPAKTPITIMHLLNHSSGLFYQEVRKREHHMSVSYTSPHSKEDSIPTFFKMTREGLPNQPLRFEPGTSFRYGYSCDCLGFIVERITGQTLEQYFQENIFKPLGMSSTSFYLTKDLKDRLMPLYFREPDGKLVKNTNQTPVLDPDPSKVHVHLGGIGLHSSERDYLKLLQHLLQIHAGRAVNPIMQTATVHMLFRPTLTETGVKALTARVGKADSQWGIGLYLNTTDWEGRRKKFSGGWYGWAGTYYFMDPTTGVAAVVATQVIPTRDPEIVKIYDQLERVLYSGLSSNF
ncbi:beta-lactamase/transpeptidase-like protein [Infundibulicybe gibba]|nr:beta-lactamase/transpeptidase-like protein [Infundibulicybe gibba]